MVGIVVVSHSARLAEGVAELVRGVGGPELPFRATGGVDAPGRPLGTDAALVRDAIEEVWSEDGVLVLMDLGSALLSADLALEMLAPGHRDRVRLCGAPVVEGAVAAAVQAGQGSPLDRVEAEARAALSAKAAHLGEDPVRPAPAAAGGRGGGVAELRVTLRNRLGLHLRPAARLVEAVAPFTDAEILVQDATGGRGPASARSLSALLGLGARQGHALVVTASGAGSEEALAAVARIAGRGFGDRDEPAPAPPVEVAPGGAAPEGCLQGAPASPGQALGPVRHLRAAQPDAP
ncbi:MAG TPA: dihydroxyacetone kinase phosphoryl donor subunit DhaM, partial [Anaeromyxobacteraceae bacterium]|nr:dihydroxyacetone kinase phosphoryl donor subunit DhaM [Anaeromyxobacteraceae bacterium]